MRRMMSTLRKVALALAVSTVLAPPPPAHAQASTDASLVFDKIEALVPMRDGVRLKTEVYVPRNAKGPLPILLTRTPYGLKQDEKGFAQALSSSYAALS